MLDAKLKKFHTWSAPAEYNTDRDACSFGTIRSQWNGTGLATIS